ncbi:hypothetical protein [Lacrimispora sp.]|jgi:hypothetical protein|uniref:hypothetical protein n=1 Tax=Lacrimispora sp. TaxID=2719234 RepID=UPI0028A20832|nr:hypothetical protein [Lacrimispora sp.]
MRKKTSFLPIYSNTQKYKAPYSATVKSYRGRKKLTVCKNRVRQSGLNGAFDNSAKINTTDKSPPSLQTEPTTPDTQTGSNKPLLDEAEKQRLACNLSRARSTIYELALCNE